MSVHEYTQSVAPAHSEAAFSAQNYSYKYPFEDQWALRNITVSLPPGQTLALLGDSGSGKTTFFYSIMGLNHHFFKGGDHEGTITLFDRDVAQTDIFRLTKDFGVVFQDFRNLLFAQTVEEAIAFPLENQAMQPEVMRARVRELMELVNLTNFAKRDVTTLSGGQGQAVAIASMLAKNPRLMVFDDITSDLDPKAQEWVRQTMLQLQQEGVSIAVADTSNPGWLLTSLANQALVLDQGKQAFVGTPDEILEQHLLVAQLGLISSGIEFREPTLAQDLISLEKVSFRYGQQVAVDTVSTKFRRGIITGIIGHNGSGKTTLSKMIAGLYQPAEGSIRIDNQNTNGLAPSSRVRVVSYLHQNPADTLFAKTTKAQLTYTSDELGIPPTIALADLGLTGMDDKDPQSLASGQKQRLAFGSALAADPQVVIFDEPTTGLNQVERNALSKFLIDLQKKGKTVIVVSHDWPMIARTTEEVLVMDQGKLVRQGPTKEVLQDRPFFDSLGIPLPW